MKKITTLLGLLFIAFGSNGQLIFSGVDLDINNVRARINNNFSLFWDPVAQTNYYEVPQGGGKQTLYTSNFWIGGYDSNNQLHVAAETYNQSGSNSWWPGPLDVTNATAANANTWNLIWKVNRATINSHISNWNTPGYIVPAEIANWPGNPPSGTNYAPVLAPFFDGNGNMIYEPALGEFPVIYGDQAIYFVCNDNYGVSQLGVPNMKLEVHGMAFAFDDPAHAFMDNTVFLHLEVGNLSGINYNNVAAGLWTDGDLGNAADDYMGTDVGRNMYYFYNADPDDDGASGYGIDPPAQGVIFLNPTMSTSLYYQNVNSDPQGNPDLGDDYYQYMTSTWLDGLPVTYGSDGRDPGAPSCNYMFPDLTDPLFATPWTMSSAGMPGNDIRGLGSLNGLGLATGEALTLDIAFTTAFPAAGTGPAGSITTLQEYADSLANRYANGQITSVKQVTSMNSIASLSVSPNPVSDVAIIKLNSVNDDKGILRIMTIEGKVISEQYINSKSPVMIQKKDFAAGVYIISAMINDKMITQKMIVN